MGPEEEKDQDSRLGTKSARVEEAVPSFDESINLLLRYDGKTYDAAVVEAAERLSSYILTDGEACPEIEKAKVFAGIAKLALGAREEDAAFEYAGQLVGGDRVLGAVVLSLSAMHGPKRNLFSVAGALINLDCQLAASVLVEVAQHDPEDHERTRALRCLVARLPDQVDKIIQGLTEQDPLVRAIQEQRRRLDDPIAEEREPKPSRLTEQERAAVMRIFPAIQQTLSSGEISHRRAAVAALAREDVGYAIPLLTIAAQVHQQEVRCEALKALGSFDVEMSKLLESSIPTLVSRIVNSEMGQDN